MLSILPRKKSQNSRSRKKLAIKMQRKNTLTYKENKKQDLLCLQLEKESGKEMH